MISGLFRREEGDLLVFADPTGKEITIPKKSVRERTESETSLMPEIFADTLDRIEFLRPTGLPAGEQQSGLEAIVRQFSEPGYAARGSQNAVLDLVPLVLMTGEQTQLYPCLRQMHLPSRF